MNPNATTTLAGRSPGPTHARRGPRPWLDGRLRTAARTAAIGLLALLAGTALAQAPAQTPAVPVGKAMPDVVMTGLNGPSRSIASYRGRPLIILNRARNGGRGRR